MKLRRIKELTKDSMVYGLGALGTRLVGIVLIPIYTRYLIKEDYGILALVTMYGYLAVDRDGNTIRGLRFFDHGETPGLGDQIDRPAWRELWNGKQLFGAGGEPMVQVIKGVGSNEFEVDGLAGATLTGRGVQDLVHYWAGNHGYGPYLARLREAPGSATEIGE